jgi:hypothetical protein
VTSADRSAAEIVPLPNFNVRHSDDHREEGSSHRSEPQILPPDGRQNDGEEIWPSDDREEIGRRIMGIDLTGIDGAPEQRLVDFSGDALNFQQFHPSARFRTFFPASEKMTLCA